jgi:hypothetical protein
MQIASPFFLESTLLYLLDGARPACRTHRYRVLATNEYRHAAIAQFLGLVKVSLREWMRPMYKGYADTVAFQLVGLSILMFLIGALSLVSRGGLELLHRVPFPVRLVVLLVLTYPFTSYFLEGERPERGAIEARARWPRLAQHALAISISFCLVCFLPVVIFLVLNP